MAIFKVENRDLSSLLDRLSGVINLNKDLPMNIFVDGGFLFWFFERPLLCCFEVFAGLISNSVSSFKSDVFVKFSGGGLLEGSCYSLDGTGLERDIPWLNRRFNNFFDGAVGYPIVLCDGACSWVALKAHMRNLVLLL